MFKTIFGAPKISLKFFSVLEKGFEIRKRKKNIIERGIQRGNNVKNVVVVDLGGYYKLIHAGEFTLSKKVKKLMRDKNGI